MSYQIRFGKIFYLLVTAVVLSLLMLLIPATPALAQPGIALSPSSGSIGTKVTITGTHFESFRNTEIRIFFGSVEIDNSPLIVPDSGAFTTSFNVPAEADSGIAYVRVSTVLGGEVRQSFIVQEPEIEIYPGDGIVGTEVTINGKGFYAGGTVTVYYRDAATANLGNETASAIGEFTYTFSVPGSVAGAHEIMVEDALDNSAEASFTVIPDFTMSSSSGAIGDSVTVTGTAFGKESDIAIKLNNVMVATDITDKYGSFEVAFAVPVMESGTYDIKIRDDDGNQGRADFDVAAGASLSQTAGNVGTPLAVSGVGFKVGSTVAITYDNIEVATAVAGANGAFSIIFNVPASIGGNHTVTSTDGISTIKHIFTVESTAPPTPALFLPEDASESEAEIYFDWEDVEDPSGVTYTLQVASDVDFDAIVLQKEGLTQSEYFVTEGEELLPTKKEAPYYWRVKAVDGAFNESQWPTPMSLYVGSSFTLPGWARYILIGLGIVLIVFLAFWFGRRTAYYQP